MAFIVPTLPPTSRQRPVTRSARRPRRPICAAVPSQKQNIQSTPPASPPPAETYLLSLGLSREDARRALSRHPRLLDAADLAADARPTLSYLRTTLKLTPRQTARAVRNAPQIFFKDRTAFAPRLEFLENVARVAPDNVATCVAKCPHLLWMNLRSAADVVELVVDACPLIAPTTLGVVFSRVPQALITAPAKIRANIDNIRRAGVSDSASMGRIFSKAPLALVYDAKKSLGKRLSYLSEDLNFSTATVGKILVSTPEVLEWSVEKVLKPRIALLESLVGDDAVAAVVDKVPSIFGEDDILDRILWLRDEVGFSDEQIRTIIRNAPAILTYSVVGNLAPKWTFIHETMHGTREDIVAAPRESLCANLQQRAMPRYAFLASSGVTDVPVLDILRGSDAEFCRSVAKCNPDVFRSYVDNDTYLLFFSQLI